MKRVLLRLGDNRRVHVPMTSETEASGNGCTVTIEPDRMIVRFDEGGPIEFTRHNNLWKHEPAGYLAIIEDAIEPIPIEKRATVEQVIAFRKKATPQRVLGVGDHLAIIINASYIVKAAALITYAIAKVFGHKNTKCGCSERIVKLNQLGPDWAEANINDVVEQLRAGHRELQIATPFVESVARTWITEAIRRTRDS